MYYNTQTEEFGISFTTVREAFPNVSLPPFGANIGDYVYYQPAPMPLHDADTQGVREVKPVYDDTDEVWNQQWEVYDLTPEEAQAVFKAKVPPSVTMRQARIALLGAGLLDDVEAALDAMPEGPQKIAARIEWDFSSEVERNKPLVLQLSASMGLTEQMLDQLFITATTL